MTTASLNNTSLTPLSYSPSYETPEKDEAHTIEELMDTLRKIREKTFEDTGHAMRSVHVKSHGILKGELMVFGDLPETLAQSMFATPATYPLVMRFSTTPGDMLPDKISTPRGCAIKIIGVEGERLPGSENDVTQDFVMVNGDPMFQVPNLKKFLMNLKLLAATTDKAEGAKVALSAAMRGAEKLVEALGSSSSKLKNMGGEPENHILGETFFTQVPQLFGHYMVKFSLAPVSPELKRLSRTPLNDHDNPTAIRDAVMEFFRDHDAVWELRAQLCTDIDTMPIEDASKEWPQEQSPYIAVARVTVPRQTAWSEARSKAVDDGMSFSPWHGLASLRPLGSIMRGRQAAYEASARFRSMRNNTKVEEPKTLDAFPA